jgi:tetratricopeptide (TPR) repeat protein
MPIRTIRIARPLRATKRTIMIKNIYTFLLLGVFTPIALYAQEMPITSGEQSAIEHFRKGRDIFHLAWFEEAPSQLNKAIQLDSTLAIAYVYLAMTEYFQYQDPFPFVDKAKFYGKNASPGERWLINGWEKFINADYLQTVSYMDSLLAEYPDDNFAKHILGFSYRDAGNPEKAVEVLSQLTDGTKPFGPAYNHLGFSYHDLGETEKAFIAADQFIDWAPQNPSAYDTKGHMLYDMGEYEKAIPYFFKGVLLESRFAYCQRFLADAFLMNREIILARKSYFKAMDMAETYGEAFKLSVQKFIGLTYMAEDDMINAESVMIEVMHYADLLSMNAYKLNVLESLIKYTLASKELKKASDYLDDYRKEAGAETDSKKYELYSAWLKILEDSNNSIGSSIEHLGEKERLFLEGLSFEEKDDLEAALAKYLSIKQSDLYIKSRIRDLLSETGQMEASQKIEQEILRWKGYPDLDYVLAIQLRNK